MTAVRKCPLCNAVMTRAARESEREFANRKFCSKPCASKSRAAKYDALLRPKADPQKPGPKPAPKPACLACGKPTATPTSKYCSVLCANRHKPRSGAQVSQASPEPPTPPKPRMATQKLCGPKPERPTGTHLTTIPKKKKAWPQGDPELCVHPARPVDYFDGYAIVAEWAACGNAGQNIVRGWTATIPEDATGLVVPRFERKETAALFDRMIENRTGRRAA